MPFVTFKTVEPYREVVVNSNEVFGVVPEPSTLQNDCELLADASRQILVLEPADQAAAKLGADFRQFEAASTSFSVAYVNRRLVLHILPHPQVKGVCLVHGRNRRMAVKGTLAEVSSKLA
jgi:hypothetical protein